MNFVVLCVVDIDVYVITLAVAADVVIAIDVS